MRALPLIVFAALCGWLMPGAAHADVPMIVGCAQQYGFDPMQATNYTPYTVLIIYCVQGSIMAAVEYMLMGISVYMAPTVSIMLALSLVFFGIRIAGGERQMIPKAAQFIIRMALVTFLSYDLGGFSQYVFGIQSDLAILAGGDTSPFVTIDNILGMLLGVAPNLIMYQGLLGLIGTAFLSSSTGVPLFAAGLMALYKMLQFIFDIVYTYVSSLIIVGFLLVLSPLFVPLMLFTATERYLKKWVDLLIMAIIMPMLLFGFLYMFLTIASGLITNVFSVLGCDNIATACDFSPYWKTSITKGGWLTQGSWMLPWDQNSEAAEAQEDVSQNSNPLSIPAISANSNPLMHNAMDFGIFKMPNIDFGDNGVQIMQQLIFAFVLMWIFFSLFESMLHTIPGIASSIAGVLTSIPVHVSLPPKERAAAAMSDLKLGTLARGGAIVGGQAAGMMSNNPTAREGGGLVGMVVGGIASMMESRR